MCDMTHPHSVLVSRVNSFVMFMMHELTSQTHVSSTSHTHIMYECDA